MNKYNKCIFEAVDSKPVENPWQVMVNAWIPVKARVLRMCYVNQRQTEG